MRAVGAGSRAASRSATRSPRRRSAQDRFAQPSVANGDDGVRRSTRRPGVMNRPRRCPAARIVRAATALSSISPRGFRTRPQSSRPMGSPARTARADPAHAARRGPNSRSVPSTAAAMNATPRPPPADRPSPGSSRVRAPGAPAGSVAGTAEPMNTIAQRGQSRTARIRRPAARPTIATTSGRGSRGRAMARTTAPAPCDRGSPPAFSVAAAVFVAGRIGAADRGCREVGRTPRPRRSPSSRRPATRILRPSMRSIPASTCNSLSIGAILR